MTLPDRAEQRRKSRRIGGNTGPKRTTPADEQPPRERPKWNILERQADAETIAELTRKNVELEKQLMEQEKSLVITQYGESKDLAVLRERVKVVPYGAKLSDTGRSMVAQICYLLDWNPFFDMHAWEDGGKLNMMPDYKKLLSMAKEQQRINHSSRPMTDQERAELGLTDKQTGFVTEVKEIDTFLEFAKAGVSDEYAPVIGYGIYSAGERPPATWTGEMVARKRSLRNALYQLTNYKIVTKRFRDALMQVGAVSVGEVDDGFVVDLPDQLTEGDTGDKPHWWDDKAQRQRFWIAAKVLGKGKIEAANALDLPDGVREDSATWKPFISQFPDLENAIAYVNVVAENLAQQAEESAAPEIIPDDQPVVINGETGEVINAKCANCNEAAPTNEGPFPKLCALCAKKAADHAASNEAPES